MRASTAVLIFGWIQHSIDTYGIATATAYARGSAGR